MQFFLKNEIEDLRHLISRQLISPIKQNVKAITDLAPVTYITEARNMIGLIGYYRKFLPILSNMIQLPNPLTETYSIRKI